MIGVTLNCPMSNVGSTVNGGNSTGLQQNRLRSFSCLSDVITHGGSGAILTSLINAVLLVEGCFLLSTSRRNQGSSSSEFSERVFFAHFLASLYLERSLTWMRYKLKFNSCKVSHSQSAKYILGSLSCQTFLSQIY